MTSVPFFSMTGSLEKGTTRIWVSLLALYLALSSGICLDKSLSVCLTNYPDKSAWGEQINSRETQQKHCLHKLIPGSALAAMPTLSSLRRRGELFIESSSDPWAFQKPQSVFIQLGKWRQENVLSDGIFTVFGGLKTGPKQMAFPKAVFNVPFWGLFLSQTVENWIQLWCVSIAVAVSYYEWLSWR